MLGASHWPRIRNIFAMGPAFLRRRGALLGACLILVLAHVGGALKPIDDNIAAARARMVQRSPSGSLVVVEIDARSLNAAGEWPWPRERFARAIQNLHNAGATLIAFDVDFSARSNDTDDSALRTAIDANPGSIVLPTFMQKGSSEENTPLASLSRQAVLGSVNVPLDPDGRVRRYQRGYRHGEHYHASIAAILADAPYGETAPFLIDYGVRVEQLDRLSFDDAYRGTFDADLLRGKAVIIGATALELGDEFATPVHPSLPGVYVHALAYEGLRQGRALLAPNGVFALVFALLALMTLWPRLGPLDLRRLLIRQSAVLSVVLLGPLALQAIAPVSANLSLVLLAQALCVAMSVYCELDRRAAEIVRQREEHLSFVALHDPETGLPNRRAMLENLQHQLDVNAAAGQVGVVVAIGIDRFATLRGAIGYGNANRLVRSLATSIGACSGQESVFQISTATLGIVMIAPDEAGARRLCAEAIEKLDTNIVLDGHEIEIGIRAGAAITTTDADAAEISLEQATLAFDQARRQNRRIVHYDIESAIDPMVQLALISDVSRGLSRGEFSLLYQAKASLRGAQIVGAEALMRWRHPDHGEIAPDQFIQIAEETGAIDALTRWALVRAIEDHETLRVLGVDKIVSLNISGRSLADANFCEFAVAAVQRSGARLCFEITETAIIGDPLAAMSAIAVFRAAGIRVSVDDYGSGLSSLSYLKQIMADELKLDKGLIRDLATDSRNRLILKSTIDLAHGLGMSVVAEGVEDETTLAILSAMGCDVVQGYLISRPCELTQFAALCRADEHTLRQTPLQKSGPLAV